MTTPYINAPDKCDLCQTKITDLFFDGKTTMGPWANMCFLCFHMYGIHEHVTKWVNSEKGFVKTK